MWKLPSNLPKFDLQKEMEDIYRRLMGVEDAARKSLPTPPSLFELEGSLYVFETDLPGFSKEDVNVDVVKDCVRVVAKSARYGERNVMVKLPEDCESENLKATLEHGMLVVTVPQKDPNSGTRRIPL